MNNPTFTRVNIDQKSKMLELLVNHESLNSALVIDISLAKDQEGLLDLLNNCKETKSFYPLIIVSSVPFISHRFTIVQKEKSLSAHFKNFARQLDLREQKLLKQIKLLQNNIAQLKDQKKLEQMTLFSSSARFLNRVDNREKIFNHLMGG